MKKFHLRITNKPFVTNNTKQGLSVSYTYNGGQYGEIIWHLENGTDQQKLVGLVRGATLNVNGNEEIIPPYLFGRAFGDVYFLLGASQFLNDLSSIPLYTLAVYNNDTIGFVFSIPPHSTLNVPEYGFIGLQSVTANLVPVKVASSSPHMFISIYDYGEVLQYYLESGNNYGFLPDPYAFTSYIVEAQNIGVSFHERVILPIPQKWINFADEIINLFKHF